MESKRRSTSFSTARGQLAVHDDSSNIARCIQQRTGVDIATAGGWGGGSCEEVLTLKLDDIRSWSARNKQDRQTLACCWRWRTFLLIPAASAKDRRCAPELWSIWAWRPPKDAKLKSGGTENGIRVRVTSAASPGEMPYRDSRYFYSLDKVH